MRALQADKARSSSSAALLHSTAPPHHLLLVAEPLSDFPLYLCSIRDDLHTLAYTSTTIASDHAQITFAHRTPAPSSIRLDHLFSRHIDSSNVGYRHRGALLAGIEACVPHVKHPGAHCQLSSLSQYDLSATTYSPDGKVFQTDYAQKAVDNSRCARSSSGAGSLCMQYAA